MASEDLEEKKPEEEAPVEDKQEEAEAYEDAKEEVGEDEEKATENEGEEVTEEGEETTPKKGKRTRKGSKTPVVKKAKKEGEEKEPVTPVSERPTRERKVVERYSAPESGRSSATKPVNIEKGPGTQLKDIPNVAFKLSKRKLDDNLQILHTILFGKKAKSYSLKRNILQFSGYVWAENEQEKQRTRVKEKLDKCVKEKLVDFCDVLNIQINKAGTRKEELSAKLLEFLESPHATTDVLLAEKDQKGQKRKKKVTPSKNAGSGEGSPETSAKKQKDTPNVEKNEEDELDDNVEPSDPKDDPLEEEDDDKLNEETDHGEKSDEEEDEPKDQVASPKRSSKDVKEGSKVKTGKSTPAKKKTPVKTPTDSENKSRSSKRGASDAGASGSKAKGSGKKQKTEKESPIDSKGKTTSKKQSSKSPAKVPEKDQVKGKTSKKAKAEPTKEDVHAVIVDILKEVDFNTATLSDILKQLGTHFQIDLMHRKAEVKEIITDVINNMTDEEEEDEEQEAAGDDSEKEDHDDA